MDTLSKKERSDRMSLIKSKGNKSTELQLIQQFKVRKIKGWRRNYYLFGKPDFVFPKNKVAIFVDGCFWHGCSKHRRLPKTNIEYWSNKISRNIERDKLVTEFLQAKNWIVIRVWEHEIKDYSAIDKISTALNINNPTIG